VVAAVLLLSAGAYADSSEKIEPMLKIMRDRPMDSIKTMKTFGLKSAEGMLLARVMIIVDPLGGDAEDAAQKVAGRIAELGGNPRTIIKTVMTADVPMSALERLADMPEVLQIEADKPMTKKMNYARASSTVDDVQAGTTLGTPYDGSKVIVGVVDSGIDCNHADFSGRILAYWDQGVGTTGVSEIAGSSGTEYTGSQLTDGTCHTYSPDTEGHGTHVAGIAAGADSTYKGVAPASKIIAVKYYSTDVDSGGALSTAILEGADYIFKKAATYDLPAVVNLSLGTSLGAHDGTSALEVGLDNLLGTGKIIVNAAGNENMPTTDANYSTLGGIHAGVSVGAGDTKGYRVTVVSSASAIERGGEIIDFWASADSTSCKIGLYAFSTSSGSRVINIAPIAVGAGTTSAMYGNMTVSVNFSGTNTAGKKHGQVLITNSVVDSTLQSYYFDLIVSGPCTADAWLYPDYTDTGDFRKDGSCSSGYGYTCEAGDSLKTITVPGTASGIITAGSYLERATWVDINGTTHYQTTDGDCGAFGGTVDTVSLFSSVGPTADGRTKPDLVAPGDPIVSTLSSSLNPSSCYKGNSTHYKLQGTSMSSPHVAGMSALMLQKNNCLTTANIKSYLTASASTVNGSSAAYGAGKLNAVAAMQQFSANTSCFNGSGNLPSTSSCSLTKNGPFDFESVLVALFAIFCLTCTLHAKKRRKKS
jgi:subtilisin family serine protease